MVTQLENSGAGFWLKGMSSYLADERDGENVDHCVTYNSTELGIINE